MRDSKNEATVGVPDFWFSNFVLRKPSVPDAWFAGLITLTSVNLIFEFLAFLVLDRQRAAVGSDQLHFYFVEFSILGTAGRREGKAILVAQKSGNAAKNVGDLAIELREPGKSSGFLGKGSKLVLRLQIIHVRSERAVGFQIIRPGFSQADTKDGDVAPTQRLHGLIE